MNASPQLTSTFDEHPLVYTLQPVVSTSTPTVTTEVVTVVLTTEQVAALAVKSGAGAYFDVTVPGKLTMTPASCSLTLTSSIMSYIASQIKAKGCITGSTCSVEISSPKLCGKSARKLRRSDLGVDQDHRELQTTGALELEFELTTKTYCQNNKCEDAQTVANAVYATASQQLQTAIQNGSLVAAFQLSTIATLNTALATAVATSTFGVLLAPFIDLLNDWYPNWHGSSGKKVRGRSVCSCIARFV